MIKTFNGSKFIGKDANILQSCLGCLSYEAVSLSIPR